MRQGHEVSEYGGLRIRSQFLATLRSTFVFSRRSTRTEIVIYYLGCLFLSVLAGLFMFVVPDYDARRLADKGIEIALAIPAIALFARRMHDQARTGWWVMLPVALFTYSTALGFLASTQGTASRIAFEKAIRQLDLIPFFATITVLALIVMPGTKGPNRFGPDPRS